MFSKKTIIKKTMEVGGFTFLSRILGIIREVLMVRYLGASAMSDAFLTAYKIPNSLRKIFAEGALSAAFIPTMVNTMQSKGRAGVKGLMTLGFIFFEGLVIALCALVILKAELVIRFIAPGFSEVQVQQAVPILQIVMPFIFFVSSSALIAGALQAVGHFFVPAISPAILNVVFISALSICLFFNLPILYLCWFILFGGLLMFIIHLVAYIRLHFNFGIFTKQDLKRFGKIMVKFLLCLPSISIMELALFVDTSFASFLKTGSISLLYYANRFLGIPLGVFAVAFSTILLPHFARVSSYAPRRLHFYLLEAAKFVLWVTIPIALLMAFFSEKIFLTIFFSKQFTIDQVHEAAYILCAFLCGLFFFSLNKILLNLYYALHVTWVPAIVATGATIVNVVLDMVLIHILQAFGLALATSISHVVQAILFLYILHRKYHFRIYFFPFLSFAWRYLIQIMVFSIPFLALYYLSEWLITLYVPPTMSYFLLNMIGFWFWAGPLSVLFFLLLWYLRRFFGIRLYFLE